MLVCFSDTKITRVLRLRGVFFPLLAIDTRSMIEITMTENVVGFLEGVFG